jgi:hypothetical protein
MIVICKNTRTGMIHTFGPFNADLAHKVAKDAADMQFIVTLKRG